MSSKGGRGGRVKRVTAAKKKKHLTINVEPSQSVRYHTYAASLGRSLSAWLSGLAETDMEGWYTVRRGDGPRLASGTAPAIGDGDSVAENPADRLAV